MKKVGKNYYYFQAKYGYMMRHVRYMNSRDDVYYFCGDGSYGQKGILYMERKQ